MNSAKNIAINEVAIWWYHDQKRYEKISIVAQQMLHSLNFSEKELASASKNIQNAFYYYDQAEQFPQRKKKSLDEMEKYHEKVMIALQINKKLAKLYRLWWEKFMEKKYLLVAYYLFQYHLIGLTGLTKILSPILWFIMVLAGLLGHNKKNKKIATILLTKYWQIIKFFKIKGFIIY